MSDSWHQQVVTMASKVGIRSGGDEWTPQTFREPDLRPQSRVSNGTPFRCASSSSWSQWGRSKKPSPRSGLPCQHALDLPWLASLTSMPLTCPGLASLTSMFLTCPGLASLASMPLTCWIEQNRDKLVCLSAPPGTIVAWACFVVSAPQPLGPKPS